MKIRICLIAFSLLSVLIGGCDVEPVEVAPAGATPPVSVPIGPIPGPQQKPPELPTSPYARQPIALAQGRKLFVWYSCAGCHGGHGGGGMGPSLRDDTWIYGSSDAHVFDSIAAGRPHGMPTWGTTLPEDHIWKLVSYIKSMRTDLEPKPPKVQPPKVKLRDEDMNIQEEG